MVSESKENKEDFQKAREYSLEIVKIFKDRPGFDPVLVYTALSMCIFSIAKAMNMPIEAFKHTLDVLCEDYEIVE
jgi:hypothetical protein